MQRRLGQRDLEREKVPAQGRDLYLGEADAVRGPRRRGRPQYVVAVVEDITSAKCWSSGSATRLNRLAVGIFHADLDGRIFESIGSYARSPVIPRKN